MFDAIAAIRSSLFSLAGIAGIIMVITLSPETRTDKVGREIVSPIDPEGFGDFDTVGGF
ncbi:MAG: hypothetical protein LBK74_01955 [Treponema sp.]|jgi:hypothetical protein|nr:hypothetical protein [Treponema sp.]